MPSWEPVAEAPLNEFNLNRDCAEVKVQIQSHVERGSTVAIPVPGETPSNMSHVSGNPSPARNL